MLPTNNLSKFAKYKVIYTVRQTDSKKLVATRIVEDVRLPVRWDIEELDNLASIDYTKYSSFKAPVMTVTTSLSTSQLGEKGSREGYGDWYPVPEEMVEIFPWDAPGDKTKAKLTPKYPEEDKTDYLVD